MKTTLHTIGALVLFFFFGYGLQAQSSISETQTPVPLISYQEQMAKLDQQHAENFENRFKAMLPTMKVKQDSGETMIYGDDGSFGVLRLQLEDPKDLNKIVQAHPDVLKTVEVLYIRPKSTDQIWFADARSLSEFENLNRVYIGSYEKLTPKKIQSDFKNLINGLQKYPDIQFVYETLEQPQ